MGHFRAFKSFWGIFRPFEPFKGRVRVGVFFYHFGPSGAFDVKNPPFLGQKGPFLTKNLDFFRKRRGVVQNGLTPLYVAFYGGFFMPVDFF